MQNSELDRILKSLPPLRDIIKRHSLTSEKSLGQHFLLDSNITDKVASAAGNLKNHTIIEVGPGPGGLTRSLFRNGASQVIAIEKDPRAVRATCELKEHMGNALIVVEEDALKIDYPTFIKQYARFPNDVKIVANLPYNVGTELFFHWLEDVHLFRSMTLMFQKEVAERLYAEPNTNTYGRASVMAGWLTEITHMFDLPPEAFAPPPKVTSSVIYVAPRPEPLASAPKQAMVEVVRHCFNHRRKMLRASMKGIFKQPELLFEMANIDGTRRPETLTIQEFCALARAFSEKTGVGA